jgi:catechol 2,3-dioxygenase-like lactoylglutathione lyase family enzyme
MDKTNFISANMILYSRHWEKTVDFYRDGLSLKVNFITDWFVEFVASENARISIADQERTSIKTPDTHGITIALQVDDIDSAWNACVNKTLNPTEIKEHPWNARVFYVFDPEGRRIEIWQADMN